jgi:hypothetical protein
MNTRDFLIRFALLTCMTAGPLSTPVHAVTLAVQPSSIYQNGATAGVWLGHTVAASTNMNRLLAGGSFRAHCFDGGTSPITGERSLPASALFGPLQLYVTIPAKLPALYNMPGFYNVQRGSRIQCSYDWTAHARESMYTIGIPGISVPIGGEERSESDSIIFWMSKPGRSTGDDDACIP